MLSPTLSDPPHAHAPPAEHALGTIQCTDLRRRFGDNQALDGISLQIEPGSITGLLGPNGSGKSTLMRCLIGLIRPDSGQATVTGIPVQGDGTAVRKRLTYSPGELHLYGEMRADEHLRWLLRGREESAETRALEIAHELNLPLTKKVRGFSHGMKRQLCFAAAMAPKVRLRILDEITDGLDPSRRGQVLDALRADADAGTTLLLSSHHLGEVDRVCERMVFLHGGKVLADESPRSVQDRTARLVHLTYAEELSDTEPDRLAGPMVERVEQRGTRYSVRLKGSDPRPFLAHLERQVDLPSPERIEYGSVSLSELYTDLYGVRGI